MSDTNEDVHISLIEDRIKAERDAAPCNDYKAVSKKIDLCSYCGWAPEGHEDEEDEEIKMTTKNVPTVGEIDRKYKTIIHDRSINRVDKIARVRMLKDELQKVEFAAASDFSFPLVEVQNIKALLSKMSEWMKTKGLEL